MEFRLHYRGRLKANASPKEKHGIRQYIHLQLAQLWTQKPLNEFSAWIRGPDPENTKRHKFLRPFHNFTFVPLVNETMNLIADLNILLLRQEEPGGIITQEGDIDNRIKTLLDALRMPRLNTELPNGSPEFGEEPFFCLMEDDNLVRHLSITTDRLLIPEPKKLEAIVVIHVSVRVTRASLDNLGFGI